MDEKIEIPVSKSKILLLLWGAIIFVVIGVLFIFSPHTFTTSLFSRPEVIRFAGIMAVLFFGMTILFLIRKLFDNKVGLIIDDQGITDHSSGTSVGLVLWEDIQDIEFIRVASTRFILLVTDQPEDYIAKANGTLARKVMKANYGMYGSPICISSSTLKIKFSELQSLLVDEFKKRQRSQKTSLNL